MMKAEGGMMNERDAASHSSFLLPPSALLFPPVFESASIEQVPVT
jgi:hypothetical protein